MSLSIKTSIAASSPFQFKASFAPCIMLELLRSDMDSIRQQLHQTVQTTPHFFNGSTVIIDLDKLPSSAKINLSELKILLTELGLIPIGIRGGSTEQQIAATSVGLRTVKIGKASTSEAANTTLPAPAATAAKIISHPIRSGMQAYAKEGDLIVTGQVSPGAELMADGHIHIYGALRGRALAGIHGNKEARIFCRSLEADLIAIAGYYLTRDEISATAVNKSSMIQIYLQEEHLKIEPL